MVAGLVVVAGRVVTLEGVTTVRVTVPLGLLVVVVAGLVTVVVVVVGLLTVAAGASVLEVETLVVVVGLVVPELLGEISVGLDVIAASVRAPVIVGVFGVVGFVGVVGDELLPPLLSMALPAPVVPPARLS